MDIQVIENNGQLRVIETIDDSVNEPYEIIACIYRCQLNSKFEPIAFDK